MEVYLTIPIFTPVPIINELMQVRNYIAFISVVMEIVKAIQFIIIWAIPLCVARYTDNMWYLLLLLGSLYTSIVLWGHYQTLWRILTDYERK